MQNRQICNVHRWPRVHAGSTQRCYDDDDVDAMMHERDPRPSQQVRPATAGNVKMPVSRGGSTLESPALARYFQFRLLYDQYPLVLILALDWKIKDQCPSRIQNITKFNVNCIFMLKLTVGSLSHSCSKNECIWRDLHMPCPCRIYPLSTLEYMNYT